MPVNFTWYIDKSLITKHKHSGNPFILLMTLEVKIELSPKIEGLAKLQPDWFKGKPLS